MKLNLSPLCLIFYRQYLGVINGNPIYGSAKGPIVWIRNDAIGDECILAHELEHIRQFWKHGLIIHMMLLWIPSYRAWCEAAAAKVQNAVSSAN
jgi:hypothetical protein